MVPDAAVLHRQADVVVRIQRPSAEQIALLRQGQVLVAMLQPLVQPGPRPSDRGAGHDRLLDGLDPQDHARAVDGRPLLAGDRRRLQGGAGAPPVPLGKFMPMLTTAAGTMPPARVLVLGAGVAGLQAIATARRLGAVVSAFDTRPVVKEQVESLGATFLELDVQGEETAGGYAAELSRGAARARAGADRRRTSPRPTPSSRRRRSPASARRCSSRTRRCSACGRARSSSTSPPRPAGTAS